MILVVYSGSRFADWRIVDKGRITNGFKTTGINPYVQDERSIFQILNKNTELINNAEKIKQIHFFGAGSSTLERQEKVAKVFKDFFKNAKIKVDHDMLASAIATCGNEAGIVGIMGSGSNAAYYNGKRLMPNNYGLGYIMADEGSTNWMARQILKDFLTELMPQGMREKIIHEYNVDRKSIMEKIYNSANPNIFLNSFSDFFSENREDPYIAQIVKKGLEQYVKTYLVPLSKSFQDIKVNLTGSVANNYTDWVKEILEEYDLTLGVVLHGPVQNLAKYYTNKN